MLKKLFSGRIWPNGEFGLGSIRCKKMDPPQPCSLHPEAEWRALALQTHGLDNLTKFVRATEKDMASMGSSTVSNSHSLSQRRGLKGITCHGAKLVRNGAYLLQKRHGRSCLSFLTCTVPGMGRADLEAIASNWSRITRVFVQKLRRRLIAHGLSGEVVGVTEVQERRLSRRSEFALHLHLLFQGANLPYQWKINSSEYREMWNSVIEIVVPRSLWTSEDSSTRVESIRFCAEGYLGKYMSKGRKAIASTVEAGYADCLPSSWYICTLSLRRNVAARTLKLFGDSANYLHELLETAPDIFSYLSVIRIPGRTGEICVGHCGRLHRDFLHEVCACISALNEQEKERIFALVETADAR